MQILGPRPKPTYSEALGSGPGICILTSPLGEPEADSCLKTKTLAGLGAIIFSAKVLTIH